MSETASTSSSKPPCEREDAIAVLTRLRDAGHVAYFAGGCVRDELMGQTPTDYDVATDAPPQRVRELFSNTQAVGAAFGVILVRHRRSVVEVATFRTDLRYEDGRRPTGVRFTTAEEDAKRRDFTINGIFLDPLENRVIDYVGGQQDIAGRIVRAIGDPSERFAEDHLRLLRAVRFAARLGFSIEPATADAIRSHAPKLARISPERIAEELRLMLTAISRNQAWDMLWTFGLVEVIFRDLPATRADAPADRAGLFAAVAPARPIPFGLALAAATVCYRVRMSPLDDPRLLFASVDVKSTVRTLRRLLRLSNDELDQLQAILDGIAPLLADVEPTLAAKKRFLARPHARHTIELLRAVAAAGWFAGRIAALDAELSELQTTDYAPPPLVSGDDLVARGRSPGPAFKRALDFVYDEQLEGRVTERDDAIRIAEAKVGELERERPAR